MVLALLIALPIGHWMHFQVLSSGDVRWVLALLAAEVLARLTEGVSHAGYRSTGDYALHVGIFYSTLLAQSAMVWIVAAAGFGPVFAAAAILVVRILEAPIVAWLLVHRHPELSFGLTHAKARDIYGCW